MSDLDSTDALTSKQADDVLAITAAAAASDGVEPLNESALLALRHPGHARHWLATEAGRLVGYAQFVDGAGQLVVHPSARRQGRGIVLLDALSAHAGDGLAVWAFGDLPAARALANRAGLARSRGLLVLSRALGDAATPAPGAVELRPYTAADLDALHAMNAEAFAAHPEQGRLGVDDLRARMSEPWFDADGLILAFADGQPAGFHWTKRHDDGTGEVYVLGVRPAFAGRGLGRVLLDAGLAHLSQAGLREVKLWVEADNETALRLYRRAGFQVVRADFLYTLDRA